VALTHQTVRLARIRSRLMADSMSPPVSLKERKRSTIQAAMPAGESVSPQAAVRGLVDCIREYAPSSALRRAAQSMNACTGSDHGSGGG
jgi:hypothetical protein